MRMSSGTHLGKEGELEGLESPSIHPRPLLPYLPKPCKTWVAFRFRVSGFAIRVSGFRFRVSCFVFRVSCFVFRDSSFGFWVSGFGYRVLCFAIRISGLKFRVSGLGFRVTRIGAHWGRAGRGGGPGRKCAPRPPGAASARPPLCAHACALGCVGRGSPRARHVVATTCPLQRRALCKRAATIRRSERGREGERGGERGRGREREREGEREPLQNDFKNTLCEIRAQTGRRRWGASGDGRTRSASPAPSLPTQPVRMIKLTPLTLSC